MKQRASIANKYLLIFLLLIMPGMTNAAYLHPIQENPDLPEDTLITDASLTSLLERISQQVRSFIMQPGALNLEAYISAYSRCTQEGLVGRHLPHLLPFQGNKKSETAFESIIQASYHWPGGVKYSCKTINTTNKRKSKLMLKDYYRILLPGLEVKNINDNSSGKFHVLPFTKEGLNSYEYKIIELTDSARQAILDQGVPLDSSSCVIAFEPLREHHTMMSGHLMIDSTHMQVIGFHAEGKLDMATFDSHILFRQDTLSQQLLPYTSRTNIKYKYGGTHATNTFIAHYKFKETATLDEVLATKKNNRNLSLTYETFEIDDADFDTIRPILLSPTVDSILYTPTLPKPNKTRQKNVIYTFSEHMIDGGRFGDDDNRLKIYGPLDPATFDYDHINGFSLNERLRWSKVFKDKSSLNVSARIGYAFKIQELRYNTTLDWTFMPKIRQGIRISFERSNSGLSNKYIETINQALKQKKDTIDFYDLGIDYFQRYELRMEHHTEIMTGLNVYTGLQYNYRDPVRHGKMAASAEHRQELAKRHYSDFAPFIRLEWTPHQYYYFEGRRKIYINGHTPTFILEASKAFPGIWNANSNYARVELDITQNLRLAQKKYLSYRIGAGAFFNQRGEYFINYHYFTKRYYPSSWMDNRFGGIFQLLEEYWFSSSPAFARAHAMYETPYGVFHHTLAPLSKYIIKERAYVNLLKAHGKNFYTELGYAVANNYINIGLFVGFLGTDYYKFGAKVRIELEKLF